MILVAEQKVFTYYSQEWYHVHVLLLFCLIFRLINSGYGFLSFLDPFDCAQALREKNGKYLGQRPMKLTKSTWKDRDIREVKKKEKKKKQMLQSLGYDT